MKLGIAGYGFVGKAHEKIFKGTHEIIISDPAQGYYGNLKHADAIIICVSTPSNNNGFCDVQNISDVIDEGPDVPYLIKIYEPNHIIPFIRCFSNENKTENSIVT